MSCKKKKNQLMIQTRMEDVKIIWLLKIKTINNKIKISTSNIFIRCMGDLKSTGLGSEYANPVLIPSELIPFTFAQIRLEKA